MKTLTEIFQISCAISVHKKAAKKTQAKVFEKIASWQHALINISEQKLLFNSVYDMISTCMISTYIAPKVWVSNNEGAEHSVGEDDKDCNDPNHELGPQNKTGPGIG